MSGDDAHWDEGTIHAWLDGELDASTAAALESHAAGCADCSARLAEARGLVAGASRVMHALDVAPSTVTPAGVAAPVWGTSPADAVRVGPGRAWRRLRVTPRRAAIAATLLVALGITLTRDRTGLDSVSDARRNGMLTDTAAPRTAATPVSGPGRDPLLDSAIARNVQQAQPPRTISAARGIAVPTAPLPSAPTVRADTTADLRVAVGRSAVQQQRQTMSAPADRAVAGASTILDAAANATVANRAAAIADRAALSQPLGTVAAARSSAGSVIVAAAARECYRIESAAGPDVTWGAIPLPFIAALDSNGRARLFTASGTPAAMSASWIRGATDSLELHLRQIGYTGSLSLGAPGAARAGVMRSAPVASKLEAVATTGTNPPAVAPVPEQRARRAVSGRRVARDPESPALQATPQAQDLATSPNSAAAVPVVARRVSCPG